MKKCGKFLLVIGVVIAIILGYRLWSRNQMAYSIAPMEYAQDIPQVPEYVTNVKVTAVPREYQPPELLEDDGMDMTYLQIWYEYEVDGKWYRYPSDNYDLIGIFGSAGSAGWDVAHKNHMVKIGSKVLICLNATNYPDCEVQIRDSLGSQISEPFAEYYGPQYGFFAADVRGKSVRSANAFWPRFYLVLDYISLPEDYEIEFVYQFDGEEQIYTLTLEAMRDSFQ